MKKYIDREEALKNQRWNGRLDEYVVFVKEIEAIPVADVVEVRHGRWIKSPECPEQYDICSVCGMNDKHRSRGDAYHPAFESIPPFCKWCGAKMDGGGE